MRELASRQPQRQCRAPWWADEVISLTPKHPLTEGVEARQREAAELAVNKETSQELTAPDKTDHEDPTVHQSIRPVPDLHPQIEGDRTILREIRHGYTANPLFAKVLENVEHHHNFEAIDGLLYTHNHAGDNVLCIPSAIRKKRRLTEIILAQAHEVLGHFGPQKTADYIRRHYWWPRIGQDIEQYCKTCPKCQTTKSSTQKVPGLLHSLPVPTRPWESIAMDFVGPFPESGHNDYLWVVLCRLTSMVHLVPIHITTMASELAWQYVREI